MIKFVIGLIVGGSLGFLWSGLFRAGGHEERGRETDLAKFLDESPNWHKVELREHPKQTKYGASADYAFVTINKDALPDREKRTAFKPRKDFLPGCPHVCANCAHWDHALFAWGAVDFCDVTYRNREAGTVCDAIVRGKHE